MIPSDFELIRNGCAKVGPNTYESNLIPNLFFINPPIIADPDGRGTFQELYERSRDIDPFANVPAFVQQSESNSVYGTVRGIHFERMWKLVRCVAGEIFCAYIQVFGVDTPIVHTALLTPYTGSVLIPPGVGNSFVALSESATYSYSVTRKYLDLTDSEKKPLHLLDPDLPIDWPIPTEEMILSNRDQNGLNLVDFRKENS